MLCVLNYFSNRMVSLWEDFLKIKISITTSKKYYYISVFFFFEYLKRNLSSTYCKARYSIFKFKSIDILINTILNFKLLKTTLGFLIA